MDIKKENGKIITTMSFSEAFFSYDNPELSYEIINSFEATLCCPFQPERLSERDHIGDITGMVCDSPNTPTKGSESNRND